MVSKFSLPHSFTTTNLVNKAVSSRTTLPSDFASMLYFHFSWEKILERMRDNQKRNKEDAAQLLANPTFEIKLYYELIMWT